jgi:hypothetical protein
MGLHIYSGSLVRYFTNDWENEIQRMARENGIEYRAHFADGEPKWPTREAAAEHVAWMRSTLLSSPQVSAGSIVWNDDIDLYHTIKLHQDARDAIAVVAAHLHRPDLPMPTRMPLSADDDEAYAEAGPKGYLLDAIAAFDASLVVPGTFSRVSITEDPLGEKRITCSTDRLRTTLNDLRKRFWNDQVQPSAWLDRGLVFARDNRSSKQVGGEWVEERDEEPQDSLRGNAEFAFSVYTSMLEFSDRHKTAIVTTW